MKALPGYRLMRTTFLRIAAVALILLSLGTAAIYMNNSGYFSKKITVMHETIRKIFRSIFLMEVRFILTGILNSATGKILVNMEEM